MSDEWTVLDGSTPDGFVPAAGYSVVAHSPGNRKGMCAAKGHTCGARRTKTSIYCVGHERAMNAGKERQKRIASAAKAQAAGVDFKPEVAE